MTRLSVVGFAAVALLMTSCGGGGDSREGGTVVSAVVEDGSITLSEETVSAGDVTLDVVNEGSLVHEIEVFSGDTIDLPISNGVADTSDMELVDEVEDVIPGGRPTLNLELGPGSYIMMCNLPGHYAMGMVTKLTVTG